jgi:adenine-specific DNA-methyltransferase
MASSKDKFLHLLYSDLLKVDLADLDFGFYRILKYRRDEVRAFFDKRLPEIMAEAMQGQAADRQAEVDNALATVRGELDKAAGLWGIAAPFTPGGALDPRIADMPAGKRWRQLTAERAHLEAASGFSQTEEDRLYNHLYLFFSRYYADGDFIRQPRRGREGRYSVAYNGEDVHFHWRGRGSHYVKTTEELTSYRYRDGDWTVEFQLAEASQEQDNVKGKTRYFFPQPAGFDVDAAERTACLPFVFRPLTKQEEDRYKGNGGVQERIIDGLLEPLQARLQPGLDGATLAHHIRRYTRKHRTDYFVHPNLGAFLRAELDWYLKNEFLDLDAIAGSTDPAVLSDRLIKLKALRSIGGLIIDFLDQIETFQAALFEKRKLVLRADYLAPVRLLDRALWPEILKNPAQIAAWRDLFGLAGAVTEKTLEQYPTLVVDTRHFDEPFKLRLLACYEDIDEALDGLLVHAENYAALRTLEYRYRGRVKCIYIDPPYNTGSDEFLYKDDFSRHSTWLTMMEERLPAMREALDSEGVLFSSIDSNEYAFLHELLLRFFGKDNSVGTIVWKGATDNNPTRIQFEHEYIECFVRDTETNPGVWSSSDIAARDLMLSEYERLKQELTNLDELQAAFRFFIKNNKQLLNPLTHYDRVDNDGPYTGSRKVHNPGKEGYRYDIIHPNGKPCVQPARGYRFPPETAEKLRAADKFLFGDDENQIVQIKEYLRDYRGSLKGVVELDGRIGANALESLFGSREIFKNPKPVALIEKLISFVTADSDLVADYFAGSGTTVQAVIEQNRTDGATRQFLAVEHGPYFDSTLTNRTIKVIAWPAWKNGRREDADDRAAWVERSPRLVKILRLESFEDSLNALELPEERNARLAGQQDIFGDDYLLKYMFAAETEDAPVRLNTPALERPFDYKLRVRGNDGLREVPVDLVETFNLLMGFHVQRIRALADGKRPYRIVEALEDGRPVLVVWRDMTDFDHARDRAFVEAQYPKLAEYATVYVNGDSSIPNGRGLDGEFHRRMNERDEHFLQ